MFINFISLKKNLFGGAIRFTFYVLRVYKVFSSHYCEAHNLDVNLSPKIAAYLRSTNKGEWQIEQKRHATNLSEFLDHHLKE